MYINIFFNCFWGGRHAFFVVGWFFKDSNFYRHTNSPSFIEAEDSLTNI
jgi:hypothetical protein